jgi:nucleoside-diphosphate-sugar epimerase
MTSDPTKSIKAAVLGRAFSMAIGGAMDMQYADDVAQDFIRAVEAEPKAAPVFNLRGVPIAMEDVVIEIERQIPAARGLIRAGQNRPGIAANMDDSGLRRLLGDVPRTELATGIAETIAIFRRLQAEGRLDAAELGAG